MEPEESRWVGGVSGSTRHQTSNVCPAHRLPSIASLIETCKLNGVDPQRYFTDVLTRLVNGWPQSRIDELMPWCWAKDDQG